MDKASIKSSIVFAWLLSLFPCPALATQHKVTVLTNHIGYETNGPKHAVVLGAATDNVSRFFVREMNSHKEVLSGIPKKIGPVKKWKDWHFWTIDFDDANAEGTYYIECSSGQGPVWSYPFEIRKNVLEKNTISNVLFYFKGQRCSGLLDKADRDAKFEGSKQGTADLRGGWFDASGDYGKHLSHLSFSTYFNPQQIPLTVWSLFKTFEHLDRRNDPNFRQYKRRLLDEAMYGADYLVRSKSPRGSFYRSVSAPGPEKKAEDRRISADMKAFQIKKKASDPGALGGRGSDVEDYEYEVSFRAGAGVAIAALAIASTFKVSGDFSNSQYLKAAEDAFAFLQKDNADLTNDGKENILDDYCALLASTELYKATNKQVYKAAADGRARNLMNRLISSGKYKNYFRADDGDRPFFHASDGGFPLVSLVYYLDIADQQIREDVLAVVRKALTFNFEVTEEVANPFGYSRQLVQNKAGIRRTSFFFPHDTETAPWWQGENARLGSFAAAARLASKYFKNDKSFYDKLQSFASNQLNWILGLNPFDSCMLQGSGRNNPWYMFFESYEYTNAPGGIVNGITSGFLNDDDIDFNLTVAQTGADNDWRWGEQWLPHASWFLLAVAARD